MALENTHFGAQRIGAMLDGKKHIYFAGIGGVSMNSLAHISHLRGFRVSGYDRTPSPLTAHLEEMGITVHYENDPAHVADADMLVYTVAIPATLPEYAEAQRRGIPVVSRADYLGYIMSGYRTRIGICGMHGKSTTTSMMERVFRIGGADPTVSCGAPLKDEDGRCDRIGGEDFFIFEACEYMDSFLDFYPTQAIVLNIEMDHLDYFHSLGQIEESFSRFMERTGENGRVYLNMADANVMEAARGFKGEIITFGVECPQADYSAEEIVFSHGMPSFTLRRRGEDLCRIRLQVPGAHNICDALATAAAAVENGISPAAIAEALEGFDGAGRRMDYRGKTAAGASVYDDYAHHPTEIATTLNGAAAMDHKKLWCVFQPHTYTRTKELFDDFAQALANPKADEVIIADIYPARETDTLGMSAELLADAIRRKGGNCRSAADFASIASLLKKECGDGDTILVMGAGDVIRLTSLLLNE